MAWLRGGCQQVAKVHRGLSPSTAGHTLFHHPASVVQPLGDFMRATASPPGRESSQAPGVLNSEMNSAIPQQRQRHAVQAVLDLSNQVLFRRDSFSICLYLLLIDLVVFVVFTPPLAPGSLSLFVLRDTTSQSWCLCSWHVGLHRPATRPRGAKWCIYCASSAKDSRYEPRNNTPLTLRNMCTDLDDPV